MSTSSSSISKHHPGTQQTYRRSQQKVSASHLLNFHTFKPTPVSHPTTKKKSTSSTTLGEIRTRKALSSFFYLHSSSTHAFVLNENASYLGPDVAVKWQHVLLVKSLIEGVSTCSICLDQHISARITKCGHIFCFPCILHHLNTGEGKCPCCFHVTCVDDLRPVIFRSISTPRINAKMSFVKLKRAKGYHSPTLYPKLDNDPISKEEEATFCRFNFEDRELKVVLKKLEDDESELQLAAKNTHGLDSLYISMAVEAVHVERNKYIANAPNLTKKKSESVEAPSLSSHFYQTSDGQLCFLSSFNMRCLNEEYEGQDEIQSLPDRIEGQILAIETVHLNLELRKKLSFLSHLPLYTDIKLVEINLDKLLGDETRKKFKAEKEMMKKNRKAKVKKEKKADKTRNKQERCDPAQNIFHPMASNHTTLPMSDDFGPALGTPPVERRIKHPYRKPPDAILNSGVLRTRNLWPNLGDAVSAPVKSSRKVSGPAWGVTVPKCVEEDSDCVTRSVNNQTLLNSPSSTLPKGRRKAKKVSIFSTGGNRRSGN